MEHEPTNERDPLEAFRAEISRRVEEERALGRTAHFYNIEVEELTEDDRIMWQVVEADWRAAEKDFRGYSRLVQQSDNRSRKDFSAYLGNLITIKMGEEMRMRKKQP